MENLYPYYKFEALLLLLNLKPPHMFTKAMIPVTVAALTIVLAQGCNSSDQTRETSKQNEAVQTARQLEKEELVARGEYLVTIGGCNDCHSPKIFNEKGMEIDSSRLFSGHPANEPLFSVHSDALKPGQWIQMSPGITSFAGPWGVSFAANLTPDSSTGIGAWSEEAFIRIFRTGKHLGQENGRPILPPMPWFNLTRLKDEDLRAIYAYLRSLPAINNRVPAPLPPQEAQKKSQVMQTTLKK